MSADKNFALARVIDCLNILDRRPRPMCRDCADECGICPNSGLDCDMEALIKTARVELAAYRAAAPAGLQAGSDAKEPTKILFADTGFARGSGERRIWYVEVNGVTIVDSTNKAKVEEVYRKLKRAIQNTKTGGVERCLTTKFSM